MNVEQISSTVYHVHNEDMYAVVESSSRWNSARIFKAENYDRASSDNNYSKISEIYHKKLVDLGHIVKAILNREIKP